MVPSPSPRPPTAHIRLTFGPHPPTRIHPPLLVNHPPLPRTPPLPDSPTASEKAKERGADPTLFLVTVAAERSLKDFIHRKADYKDSFSFKYTQRAGQALRMARIQKWGRQVLLAVVALQKKGLPVLHLHCGNVLLRKGGAAALADYENVLFGFDMEQRTATVVIPHLAAGKDVAVVQFGALLWEMATGVELDTCLPSRDVELDPTIRGIIDLIFGRQHPDVAIKAKGDAAAARAGAGGGGGGDGGSGEGGEGKGGGEGTGAEGDGEGKAGGGSEDEEEEEGEDEEDPLSIDELLDMPFFAPLLLKSGGSAERDIPKLRFDSQMKGVVKTAAREATERVGRLVEEYRNSINQRRREEERVRQAIKDDTEALSGKAKNTQQAQRASRRAAGTRYKSNRSSRRGSTTSKGGTGTTSGAGGGADSNSVETAATAAAPPPPAQKTTAPAAPPAPPAAPPAAPAAPPAAPAAPPAAKAKAKKRPPLGGGGGGGGMGGGLLAAIQAGKSLKKAPPPKEDDDDDDDGGSGGGGGGPGGMLGEMMARQRAMKKG